MKIEAGPSATASFEDIHIVNRSPSTFGAFNTTTASRMIEFFMLVTVEPFFLASPRSAGVKVPTLLSGRAVGVWHDPTRRPEQDRAAGQRRESHTWFSPSVWS
jgi:hypothetical protein